MRYIVKHSSILPTFIANLWLTEINLLNFAATWTKKKPGEKLWLDETTIELLPQ